MHYEKSQHVCVPAHVYLTQQCTKFICNIQIVYTCTHTHTHIYIYIYTHTSIDMCLSVCLSVFLSVCMYACMYVRMYVCIHIHTQTYVHMFSMSMGVCTRSACIFDRAADRPTEWLMAVRGTPLVPSETQAACYRKLLTLDVLHDRRRSRRCCGCHGGARGTPWEAHTVTRRFN